MNSYDARKYWQERFSNQFDLSSVGFLGLGKPYNEWLYRKRRRVFKQMLKMVRASSASRVLEIGPGSGFYVALWKELGVSDLVGLDITSNAVKHLQELYPWYKFIQCDFTAKNVELAGQFDVITFFDVLFHVVDDTLFEEAINNAVQVLSSEGVILITDVVFNPTKQVAPASEHFRPRSFHYYEMILERHGLEITNCRCVFSFMHPRSIFDRSMWRRSFQRVLNKLLLAFLKKYPSIGSGAGRLLFILECLADTLHLTSNSITLMIIRRKVMREEYP